MRDRDPARHRVSRSPHRSAISPEAPSTGAPRVPAVVWENAASVNRRPKLQIIAPAASEEEAAALVVALERFMRDTAPTPAPPPPAGPSAWARASLLEATGRAPDEHSGWRPGHVS